MNDYVYITLRDRPEYMDTAAEWFHSKWGVPSEAYLECMRDYLSGDTEYGWYLCLDGDKIVGGISLISKAKRKASVANMRGKVIPHGHGNGKRKR